MADADQDVQVATCGCSEDMRRVCDLCGATEGAFVACSLACLDKHLVGRHAVEGMETSETRAATYLRRVNRQLAGSWQTYEGHRRRVMALAMAAEHGGDIAIFGAGNGSDLELAELATAFREIHLIDLDGEALERARAGLPAATRDKVVLHAPYDLSGFTSRLDEWGERFPDDATLGPSAVMAARGIVQRLGRVFDVVLSTGVLSQLTVPYHRAWITSRLNWGRLVAALTALHLATLAGSTRSGGTGVLAFDVLSSKDAPELADLVGRDAEALEDYVERGKASGSLRLQPDPATLLKQLTSPGLGSLVQDPRLTSPWLWNLGDAVQLVYGLQFRRP